MNLPTSMPASMPALQEVARRQLHLVLLLDCSGSMQGAKIVSLNYAVRSALPELRAVARDNPEVQVVVSAIAFGSQAHWHLPPGTPLAELQWVDLMATGETALAAALDMATEQLAQAARQHRLLPPVMVLVSDGFPTDDYAAALTRLMAEPAAACATRLAIAIGRQADPAVLQHFMAGSTQPAPAGADQAALVPLQAHSAPDLVRHIRWATTVPVKTVSSPRLGPQPADRLAAGVAAQNQANADMVW